MYLVCTVLQETYLEGVSSVPLTRNGLIVHKIITLIYNILSTDVFGMYTVLQETHLEGVSSVPLTRNELIVH